MADRALLAWVQRGAEEPRRQAAGGASCVLRCGAALAWQCFVPCCAMPCRAGLLRAMPCHARLLCAVPCHAAPCRAALCHAVPCCTVPCRAAASRSRGAGCAVAGLGQDSSPAASHPEVLQRSNTSARSGGAARKPRSGLFAVRRWAVGHRSAEHYQGPAAPYCLRFIHPPAALSLLSDRCCLSWQESGGGAVSWLAVRRGDIAPLPPGLLR